MKIVASVIAAVLALAAVPAIAGDILGHVRDPNWFARYGSYPYGVGMYEYGVNANGLNLATTGGRASTDVFGGFTMSGMAAGTYTVASLDVWFRSAYAFNVSVPASGSTPDVDVRLKAGMWGYMPNWNIPGMPVGRKEFGQTFKATGPISMIYLRCPGSGMNYEMVVLDGGPTGAQVGETRTFGTGDQRIVYGYNQMPTVAGRTYYLRIRSVPQTSDGVLTLMDPRPDYSDPMPEGCLYEGDGVTLTQYPERDLGCVIMFDDDGLLTNMFVRPGGQTFIAGSSVGQTFVARGVGLISAAAWIPDGSGTYVFKVLQNGPGGAQVGTTKKCQVSRPTGDPEVLALWAPGECPLTAGNTYYLEITRDGGGGFTAYANIYNVYAYGQAYRDGTAQGLYDLAGTIMEEVSAGSATQASVKFTTYPSVSEANRGTTSLTITWVTDVASDSLVEYAADNPPYTGSVSNPSLVTNHSVTISGLKSNTMYHYRVTSAAAGYRKAISRDLVICTKNNSANLLVNGGFEEGAPGGQDYYWPTPGWSNYSIPPNGLDVKVSNGGWYWGLPPRSGTWFCGGAVNGGASDGGIYQRVAAVPGVKYNFSAWAQTWPRENNTWKYDVWDKLNETGVRIEWMRLGIDPTGGTDPQASTVQWTPRMYSHLRYTNFAKSAVAQANYVTVFVHMKGQELQWHLFGVDDCVLTQESSAASLPDIKGSVPNNTAVNFGNVVVTAIPSQVGAYYVEMSDRSMGIRVEATSGSAAIGDRVSVAGGVVTNSNGERAITNATITVASAGTALQPEGMPCKSVGGADLGLQQGVVNPYGPNNIGLLIKSWGVVQPGGTSSYVYINDGSLPAPGLKIDVTGLTPPASGSYAVVTGICRCEKSGSNLTRLLRPRGQSDIVTF